MPLGASLHTHVFQPTNQFPANESTAKSYSLSSRFKMVSSSSKVSSAIGTRQKKGKNGADTVVRSGSQLVWFTNLFV